MRRTTSRHPGTSRAQLLDAVMADRDHQALTISPDGRACAWVGRTADGPALLVQDLGPDGAPMGRSRPLIIGPQLRGYVFLHDGTQVFVLLDEDGGENTRAALLERDARPGAAPPRPLTPEGKQCRLLAHKAARPHEVLIGLNDRDPALHDVHVLDARSGTTRRIARNPGYSQWITDHRGLVRGGVHVEDDASLSISLDAFRGEGRRTAEHPALRWHVPARLASLGGVLALCPGAGHDVLWTLEAREPEASAVVEHHLLPDGAVRGREFTSPAGAEFDGAWLRPGTGEPQLLEHGRWTTQLVTVDPTAQHEAERLRHALHDAGAPGEALVDVERRDGAEDRLWAVSIDPGTTSPRSAIWDRATGTLHDLGPQLPERDELASVRTSSYEITARDGRRLPGYLTVSAEADPDVPAPGVVLVHGGPWERDRAGFDAETTLLALSGYAVVRVNYRGSAGFGADHLAAGDREWGRAMSDDLDDTVAELAAQGRLDPSRVAIMGASYGGYAALMAACRDGFPYRCAVAAMAPTDLRVLIEQIPAYWGPLRSQLLRRVGDPQRDADLLRDASPVQRLDQLHMPLMLAHGAHDPRVPRVHIELLVAALRDRGIEHELLEFPDEGHGLVHRRNRIRYYSAALDFLDRHLAGSAAPAPPGADPSETPKRGHRP